MRATRDAVNEHDMSTTRTVQQLPDLTERKAPVTGGTRGPGFQRAQALSEAGALALADVANITGQRLAVAVAVVVAVAVAGR